MLYDIGGIKYVEQIVPLFWNCINSYEGDVDETPTPHARTPPPLHTHTHSPAFGQSWKRAN